MTGESALPVRPVFVGELTVDLLVTGPESAAAHARSFTRTHYDGDEWTQYIEHLVDRRPAMAYPGGSVANVAAAFVSTYGESATPRFVVTNQAKAGPVRPPLWWRGYDKSAADLGARGIQVIGHVTAPSAQTPGAVAMVTQDGSVSSLVVNDQDLRPVIEVPGSLLVCRTDHLARLDPDYVRAFPSVGFLLADDGSGWDLAASFVSPSRNLSVFGERRQVEDFSSALDRGVPAGVYLVGTDGPRPCLISTAEGPLELPVQATSRIVTDLGAGDAYMGGFLARFASGGTIEQAHQAGCEAAIVALTAPGARPDTRKDLNRIFPAINRNSPRDDEGQLYELVRRSPGVTLISGGQTGVDTAIAQAAEVAGLPTHVVFPANRMREDGPLPQEDARRLFGRSRLHELGSTSFRYRTWATVYLADAVIILDPARGEGSAETRRAAEFFNRPALDLDVNSVDAADVARWIVEANARTVLVAGNRASLLNAVGTDVSRAAQAVVGALCAVNSRLWHGQPEDVGSLGFSRLGVPHRATTWLERYATDLGLDKAEWVVLSARDLVTAFRRGELPAVLVWPSLLPADVLAQTRLFSVGSFAVHYGLLVSSRGIPSEGRLAVQYPEAFDRHGQAVTPGARPFTISGDAETWLTHGLADFAYDTYRTGATAQQFDSLDFYPTHWETLTLCTHDPA